MPCYRNGKCCFHVKAAECRLCFRIIIGKDRTHRLSLTRLKWFIILKCTSEVEPVILSDSIGTVRWCICESQPGVRAAATPSWPCHSNATLQEAAQCTFRRGKLKAYRKRKNHMYFLFVSPFKRSNYKLTSSWPRRSMTLSFHFYFSLSQNT